MLPLRPEDLVIGKLYKGIWITVLNDPQSDIWVANESHPNGFITNMGCFVFLGRTQDPIEMTWKCTLLTSEGTIVWTYFSTGTHWFKELTHET